MLKEVFRKYGDEFKLLDRKGRVMLYELTRDGESRGWEVMVAQWKAEVVLSGKTVPAGWSFPASSQWGVAGWSYLPSEHALAVGKFKELLREDEPKPERKLRRVTRLVRRLK